MGIWKSENISAADNLSAAQVADLTDGSSTLLHNHDEIEIVREIGGHSYVSKLGLPCPPTLDLKAYDYRDETYGVPSNVTFDRASVATQVNAQGLIESVGEDVMRHDYDPVTGEYKGWLIEESRTNLLTYSEDFDDAVWTKSITTISSNAVTAPDGTLTADKLIPSTGSGTKYIAKIITISASTYYTISLFVKSGDFNYMWLGGESSIWGTIIAYFDLANLTIISTGPDAIDAKITPHKNGWARIELTVLSDADGGTGSAITLGPSNSGTSQTVTGDGTSGIYIWGAQLEQGSFPTSYIPSTQTFTSRASSATYIDSDGLIATATTDVARMSYNPTALHIPPKLLLEGASTNLLTYSEDFDNAIWIKTRGSVSANATTAPDGTLTADKLVEDTTENNSRSIKLLTVSISDEIHTFSVYAKAETRNILSLTMSGTTTYSGSFDLSAGTIINSRIGGTTQATNQTIEPLKNGWYRCSISQNASDGASTEVAIWLSDDNSAIYTGDGTSGLYIWGAQLEESSYPTSYIPTTTAAVTRAADVSTSDSGIRAADVCYMEGTDFSDFYNSEGSIIVQHNSYADVSNYSRILEFSDGTLLNRVSSFILYHETDLKQSVFCITNGIQQDTLFSITADVDTNYNTAVSYNSDMYSLYINGELIDSGNDQNVAVNDFDQIKIGSAVVGGSTNGHIKQITYFPRKLSDSQLQLLTS